MTHTLPEPCLLDEGGTICGEPIPVYGYTADQMSAHAAAARRQALEEASHACEAVAVDNGRAWDCVRRIRSMIDKDTA